MTTIINTPGGQKSDSVLGFILGLIITITLVVLFFVYALPALRDNNKSDVNVTIPLPALDSEESGN